MSQRGLTANQRASNAASAARKADALTLAVAVREQAAKLARVEALANAWVSHANDDKYYGVRILAALNVAEGRA